MKITFTRDNKSVSVDLNETAVTIEMKAVGDDLLIRVEEQPLMPMEEQPVEQTCKWKRCGCTAGGTVLYTDPHTNTGLRHKESFRVDCPTCGKRIEVVQ